MGEEKKRSKKGLFAILAAIAGVAVFLKRRRGRAVEESGWEEASTNP